MFKLTNEYKPMQGLYLEVHSNLFTTHIND
jgi:hypothetical protein